ncbi:Fanconi anemia group E protein isoform X2 [Microcaecilia unicolor]|uniref:Fanconi anemia group E protein isoform X2 n=1 Tax=Microcaecilia unicolor TaxID=1415580 RepID=A0A6P7ZU15_9AMPH|nr:Fanconi anemia group E protein isoform X2 [Microcaecilia unicolor]
MEGQGTLLLGRFDRPSRLLLHVLMSGSWGSLAACKFLRRIRTGQEPGKRPFCWRTFTETLCRKEPTLEGPEKTLILKPVLLLLPLLCQRNLLSLLHAIHSVVPRDCLHRVLQTISQDTSCDPWMVAYRDLFQRDLGEGSYSALLPLSDTCQQQLKNMCQKLATAGMGRVDCKRQLSWFKDTCCESDPECAKSAESQSSRKRKRSPEENLSLSSCDSETEGPTKWSRSVGDGMVFEPFGGHASQTVATAADKDKNIVVDVPVLQMVQEQKSSARQDSSQSEKAQVLPDFIKSSVPRLKELLQTETDISDVVAPPELQVLNECEPAQLSELSEQSVLHFCTRLQTLTPDLSFSSARILTTSLFLHRVLSLTEPASRLLISTLTLFCSKYAGSICCGLINPILQSPERGSLQLELLCRMIEECLEPEHLVLVFRQVLEVPWSEQDISVLHALLGKKVVLSPDHFDLLIRHLCQRAPEFTKSVKFAKLMLTVLTKYQSCITTAHWSPLASALTLNDTFLRKSLQATLKRLSVS